MVGVKVWVRKLGVKHYRLRGLGFSVLGLGFWVWGLGRARATPKLGPFGVEAHGVHVGGGVGGWVGGGALGHLLRSV